MANACVQTIDGTGSALIVQIDTMHSVFDHSRLAGKPIYVTEGGWRTQSDLPDPDQQAAYIARWFLLLAIKGIVRAYWHAWDDNNWGTLWDPASGIRQPGLAYEQVYNWLLGATMSTPCIFGLVDYVGPSDSGNQVYVPPKEYKQYNDLRAETLAIHGTVIIGDKPILLETATPQS